MSILDALKSVGLILAVIVTVTLAILAIRGNR
jgi:hypothetical protein